MRPLALAILLLSPALRAETGLDALFAAADAGHWSARWDAVRRLARVQGEDLFRMRLALLKDERPRVREAVAWAALLEPGVANATVLALALEKDPEPGVRRAAARALVHFPDRRAVHALVEALVREDDERTRLRIVETLRALTPAPLLFDAAAWRAWWLEHEADARFRPADEPPVREEYDGVVLETRTVARVRRAEDDEAGEPEHVLVLPPFGWTTALFGPCLLPLRERASITWVRLPSVQSLTGRTGYGDDVPLYPVDRLVRALDRFRERQGVERFVVLAQGASGWIAMRYAQLRPDRCAGLVLVDVSLDKPAYLAALRRGARSRDRGERFTARTLLHENDVPFTERTLDRIQALALERAYRDPAELEIAELYDRARDPQGFATVPPVEFGKRTRIETPALFVYSAASVFSGHPDAERIRQAFPRGLVAPLLESAGLPYATRPAEFQRVLRAWLESGSDRE